MDITANNKDCREKRVILLSVCGTATCQVIHKLTTPGRPTNHTFEELVQLMQVHRNPSPLVTIQLFTFNTYSQKEGETVSQFMAELGHLS